MNTNIFRVISVLWLLLIVNSYSALPVKNGDRILFIGNLITSGMVTELQAMFKSPNPPVDVTIDESISPSSNFYTDLIDQYNSGEATTMIRSGHYTYVVLQGFMNAEDYPAGTKQHFLNAVADFDTVIKSKGAQTVLFWEYPNDENIMKGEYLNVVAGLEGTYETVAKQIGAPVVPVGSVFKSLTYNWPPGVCGISGWTGVDWLYTNCGNYESSYGSEAGNLAAAYTFYTTLTGKTSTGLKVPHSSISDAIDSALQFRASYIAKTYAAGHNYVTSTIPRGYQLSSVKTQESTSQWFGLNGAIVKKRDIARVIISRQGLFVYQAIKCR